ncbi:MAG: M20 family metallopeptidase [Hungatella sp.]|nr:M20 family metallopeptidase [Hungatella sp.]
MNQKENIDEYIDRQLNRQIEDICRLVRIESVRQEPLPGKPFGEGPWAALETALDIARAKGFPARSIDGCVGVVEAGGLEEGIDILAHLDVVPAGTGWTVTAPFCPLLHDGKLYGRGAADNKGPAVSVLYALDAVRSLGIPLRRRVRILWGTAEETGCEDLPHFYGRYRPAPMTVSPDAAFPVITREKGRFEAHMTGEYQEGDVLRIDCDGPANGVPASASAVLGPWKEEEEVKRRLDQAGVPYQLHRQREGLKLTVKGKAAHSASPQKGDNALVKLLALLARLPGTQTRLKEMAGVFPHGDHFGTSFGISPVGEERFTISLNRLSWNPKAGLVGVCDCRVPAGMTEDMTAAPVRKMLGAMGIRVEGDWVAPHTVPDDSEFVRTLLRCWEECSKRPGAVKSIAGNTYAHGIPGAVAYGFADPEIRTGTHGPDEYVSISQLVLGTRIYAHMIWELCR